MKITFNNIFRILFVAVILLLSVFVFFHPKKTETNILKAVLSNSKNDEILVDLSKRQAGRINVIFESSSSEAIEFVYKTFFEKLDKNAFYTNDVNVGSVLNTYKQYHGNILSYKTADLIKNKQYEAVEQQAVERLYNPMGLGLLPIEDDPFLLFDDFVKSLGSSKESGLTELDGKYYETAEFNLKKELALSPTLLNIEMKKLVELKDSLSDKETQVYLAGSPVHTYFASSKSMREINLICIISSLFIILLCKFYFNSFKILIPIGISLALGMFTGYIVTSCLFDSIHILTFVFASTLIGICVDYSLHYFAHNKDLKLIMPSLTQSLLTTVCAFLVLQFSNIELLKQISVFTVTGLICVYLFVVLFYPLICKNIVLCEIKQLKLRPIDKKQKAMLLAVAAIVIFAGMFNIKFNDDIKDMYVPPKDLANAEKLYAKLSDTGFDYNFVVINGDDEQTLLQKEEQIAQQLVKNDMDFYSLSKFVPSIKRQEENRLLINTLYKNSLKPYAQFLSADAVKKLLTVNTDKSFLTVDKLDMPMLKDFLIDKNTSIMIINGDVKSIDLKNAKVINLKNDISQKVRHFRQACMLLFAPAALLLFVILAFIYKPKNALKIVAPSILGALFSIGLIGVFNQSLNLFHILAMFLIIGFSMDYSIFRFNGSADNNSKSAVLISCVTSAFSFLLLSMTSFKLISSLGFILCVGLLSSYILSILLISKSSSEQTLKE